MLRTLLLLIVSLTVAVFANSERDSIKNGPNNLVKAQTQPVNVTLTVGGPWETFEFTNPGAFALTSFVFSVIGTNFVYLQITDLYCQGDSFAVYSDSSALGITAPVATSCIANVTDSSDPDVCYTNAGWSSHQFFFATGDKYVRIVPVISPYTAGLGAIRIVAV
jgi:hypothetical protein